MHKAWTAMNYFLIALCCIGLIALTPNKALAASWEWDDGGSSNDWSDRTQAKYEDNWDVNTNPQTVLGETPFVKFGNLVGSDQSIRIRHHDPVVHKLIFEGPNMYTIRGNQTIFFDSGIVGGNAEINTLSHTFGNSDHVLNTDINASVGLDVNHAINQTLTFQKNITLNANDFTIDNTGEVQITRNITGSGDITKQGSGLLQITRNNNNFTGNTTIQEGILRINNDNSLGNTGTITVESGGTLSLVAGADPNNNLSITGMGSVGQGALSNFETNNDYKGNITLVGDASIGAATGTRLDIRGVISGSDDLTTTGAGTIRMEETSTLTGNVTVESGTLELRNTSGESFSSASAIIIESGGTVLYSRDDQLGAAVGINLDGGTLDLGARDDSLGSLTLSSSSTIDFDGGSSTFTFTDAFYTGGTLTVSNWTSGNDQLIFSVAVPTAFLENVFWEAQNITGARQLSTGEIIPIPEPSTYLTGIAGLLLIGLKYGRKIKLIFNN